MDIEIPGKGKTSSNFFGDVPFNPEAGEQLIGQYKTKKLPARGHPAGDAGALILTSQRVVFFKREGVLKRIFKSETPNYTLISSVPIPQLFKVDKKGGFDPSIIINGARYYLENADPSPIVKILKSMMKSVKKGTFIQQIPVQQQQPVVVAPPIVRLQTVAAPVQPVQQPVAPSPPASRKPLHCSVCGMENQPDGRFCTGCGSKLQ